MAKEESRAKKGMGGGKKSSSKKSGKHPYETHIRHVKNGGHIVRHSFKPDADTGAAPEDEEHVMADKAALLQHLQEAVPDNGPAAAGPPPDASAAAGPPPPSVGAGAPPPTGA